MLVCTVFSLSVAESSSSYSVEFYSGSVLQLVLKDDQYRELQQQMSLTREGLQKDLDQVKY